MAVKLQGFTKQVNKKIGDLDLSDKVKEFVINSARDVVLEWLKEKKLQDWIAERVSGCAQAAGIQLTFTDITNKEATRGDIDRAVTARVNQLAGTSFASLDGLNREAVKIEAGRMLGVKLGTGPLYPVENFRDAISANLVQSFAGQSAGSLFPPEALAAIEEKVVKQLQPITEISKTLGNPMSFVGAPSNPAEAAKRADNRRRQAKYRRNNRLQWQPMGGAAP